MKEPAPASPAPPSTVDAGPPEQPSTVAISPDIRQACGISESEAFFAYDSAALRAQDGRILRKLAECFTSGPLKGRQMRLVGHADPRGDEEYNYLLGQRRADSVKSGIVLSGLMQAKVSSASRGEEEARGADESGWIRDRRVDVLLGE